MAGETALERWDGRVGNRKTELFLCFVTITYQNVGSVIVPQTYNMEDWKVACKKVFETIINPNFRK